MNQIDELLSINTHLRVRDCVDTKCASCLLTFSLIKRNILIAKKRGQEKLYCSQKCYQIDIKSKRKILFCKQCNININKQFYTNKIKFCSMSCAAIYNNAHKTTGVRRSKLEIWLEQQLHIVYPKLIIHFNIRDVIKSELDIYIPSIKLAFELNGIFHYKPIFGEDKLLSIINNDAKKFQACLKQKINLYILDTSSQKKFTEQSSKQFLDKITQIIDIKLVE